MQELKIQQKSKSLFLSLKNFENRRIVGTDKRNFNACSIWINFMHIIKTRRESLTRSAKVKLFEGKMFFFCRQVSDFCVLLITEKNEYLSMVFGSCCSHIYYYNIYACQHNQKHVWLVHTLILITKKFTWSCTLFMQIFITN